ncbi:M48 family metallopeptidase [Alicyclobacillus sp. TC]|uniref:Metal-dependent hydrolase n=1 Tax=Alicyclobacillus tolerans TaxID=90970 RepID=A0ABT9LZ89_9BACL|nr:MULTISPECIES: SprT family zinc-dependent metalloprotease [Alicyclobacillus]MDP9729600.1 putative metal-dependent hydrolase [Alicyclobacillus tengchongensis]QRF23564.1 M48 family metallopeptidase [Alicyclobacillus sp. TC]
MPTFTYGTTTIKYTMRHQSSKRDCTITVDWKTGVSVVVPDEFDQEHIDAVLRRKAPWILRRLIEFSEIKPLSTRHEFISGEKFPYLGRQYRLKVLARDDVSDVSLAFQNGRFVATVPKSSSPTWRGEHLRKAFRDWYITHGAVKVQQRIRLFAPRLGLEPSKVVIKDQQARWGSCTKNGTINVNWRVLMAPMRIVDYVVVHELGHMIHADHSAEFWTVVASVMPDYDERKEWLRVHGAMLDL